jgi:DNA-binding transcriptional regulator YiaG
MSILSELKRRAGPRVQILDAPPRQSNSSGERVSLVLKPPRSRRVGNLIDVALLLVRSEVPPRVAKEAIERLVEGKTAYVYAPSVVDFASVQREMKAQRVTARRVQLRSVDVKALRARLGLSQEEFAGRYGLDVEAVQQWEHGRSKPEGPTATLLQLIDRAPGKVVELLAS